MRLPLLLPLLLSGCRMFLGTELRPPPDLKVEPTEARVARGEYLTRHVSACFGCHSRLDLKRFSAPPVGTPGAGGHCWTEPTFPGTICAQNITNHADGLASWTDGEIARALREGVNREGETLFPMMPYAHYRHMADEDVEAIIAFLRTATAAPGGTAPTEVSWPTSMFINFAPKPLAGPVAGPNTQDSVDRGRYLSTIGGCLQCHTPVDSRRKIDRERLYAGGQVFQDASMHAVSANLSPHPSGLLRFTKESFLARFAAFREPESLTEVGPGQQTPMPWWAYAGMSPEDLGAIYDYLMTLPPIDNAVLSFPDAK